MRVSLLPLILLIPATEFQSRKSCLCACSLVQHAEKFFCAFKMNNPLTCKFKVKALGHFPFSKNVQFDIVEKSFQVVSAKVLVEPYFFFISISTK